MKHTSNKGKRQLLHQLRFLNTHWTTTGVCQHNHLTRSIKCESTNKKLFHLFGEYERINIEAKQLFQSQGKLEKRIEHTEYFLQMALIDIPAEFVYVKNKWLTKRRRFPDIKHKKWTYEPKIQVNCRKNLSVTEI